MDFLDVKGASGTAYRFRRATLDQLPVNGGNLLALTGPSDRPRYLACAKALSLSAAAPPLQDLLQGRRPRFFIRLNVSRGVRDAEHADIVAANPPEYDLAEPGLSEA